jgi:hypothetical protein
MCIELHPFYFREPPNVAGAEHAAGTISQHNKLLAGATKYFDKIFSVERNFPKASTLHGTFRLLAR